MKEKQQLNATEKRLLWLLAAVEGGSVMVMESLCAKYLAPAYGESLQVWASAMGVTLVGLTIGYFLGSLYAQRFSGRIWLLSLLAGVGMVLTPSLAEWLIPQMFTGKLFRDSFMVSAVLLLPTLSIVGMLPAMIVARLSEGNAAGQVAGRVFAVSTVGAISAVYLNGFLFVPKLGVTLPLIFAGLSLSALPMLVLLQKKQWMVLLTLLPAGFAFWSHHAHRFPANASIQVIHYNEGILGQVLVGDFPYSTPQGENRQGRALYVNRMPQTMVDKQTGDALYSPYIDFMDVATHPIGDGDLLLLGLGGGNLVNRFLKQGREVDVCELDPRVVEASEQYFSMGPQHPGARFFVDDARHFIRKSKKKYDLIAYDIFRGESPPHHAFTVEAFEDAAKILKPGGMVLINFLGRTNGERGKAPVAVIKTLMEAKFQVQTLAIPNIDNVIVVACRDRKPPIDARLVQYEVPVVQLDLAHAPVLTDDRPLLELLHAETASWNRAWYNKTYTTKFLKENVPLFR